MHTIFCFGDSVTLGLIDQEGGGWVARIAAFLMKQHQISAQSHLKTIIYNLGVAHETTDGLLRRVGSEIKHRSLKKGKHTTVLCYGLNDIRIHKQKNLVPLEYFIRNLTEVLNQLEQLNHQVLLLSIPPFVHQIDGLEDGAGHLRYHSDRLAYNQALQQLSLAYVQSHFIDLEQDWFADHINLWAQDGLHPSSAGHQKIAERLIPWLT